MLPRLKPPPIGDNAKLTDAWEASPVEPPEAPPQGTQPRGWENDRRPSGEKRSVRRAESPSGRIPGSPS